MRTSTQEFDAGDVPVTRRSEQLFKQAAVGPPSNASHRGTRLREPCPAGPGHRHGGVGFLEAFNDIDPEVFDLLRRPRGQPLDHVTRDMTHRAPWDGPRKKQRDARRMQARTKTQEVGLQRSARGKWTGGGDDTPSRSCRLY